MGNFFSSLDSFSAPLVEASESALCNGSVCSELRPVNENIFLAATASAPVASKRSPLLSSSSRVSTSSRGMPAVRRASDAIRSSVSSRPANAGVAARYARISEAVKGRSSKTFTRSAGVPWKMLRPFDKILNDFENSLGGVPLCVHERRMDARCRSILRDKKSVESTVSIRMTMSALLP